MMKQTCIIGKLSFFIATLFLVNSCIVVPDQYSAIPPGPWRVVLELEPNPVIPNPDAKPQPEKLNLQFEEVTGGELPFNFEVTYESPEQFYIEFINGEERIRIDDIDFGRKKSRARDSIVIRFPVYGSYFEGFYEEDVIEGRYYDPSRGNYSIPFVARHGKDYRFTNLEKDPVMDISGKWEVDFSFDSIAEAPYKAIGEFEQSGNYLTGTFITETGDYRFLEGTVQDDKIYLSAFDGSHAFLFEAKILEDSTIIGRFKSGIHYQTVWKARKNTKFELSDSDSLTYLKPGYDKLSFSFENSLGQTVSLEDDKFDNKVKIVQIMSTSCPNCRDETNFLINYLKENPSDELEVVALAFERYQQREKAFAALDKMKEKMGIPYEILLAGDYSKSEAARVLPMLNDVIAFPTMIIIDQKDKIQRIHTGFSGPATSQFASFKKEFEGLLAELLR